jgi:hypothetical protein
LTTDLFALALAFGGLGGFNLGHDAGLAALRTLFGLAAGVHLPAALFTGENGHGFLLGSLFFI